MIITKPLPARINIIAMVLAIAAFAANAWAGEFYEKEGAAIKGIAYSYEVRYVKGR